MKKVQPIPVVKQVEQTEVVAPQPVVVQTQVVTPQNVVAQTEVTPSQSVKIEEVIPVPLKPFPTEQVGG